MNAPTGITYREMQLGSWRVFFSAPGDRASLDALLAHMRANGEADSFAKVKPAGGTLVSKGEPVDPTTCVWTFKTLNSEAAAALAAVEAGGPCLGGSGRMGGRRVTEVAS